MGQVSLEDENYINQIRYHIVLTCFVEVLMMDRQCTPSKQALIVDCRPLMVSTVQKQHNVLTPVIIERYVE